MPKAVFWLLWDTIKKGNPIGAYVKNRAKDGRYYWVFAIVTPVENGYLSVRLKPGSPIFSVVQQEYKNLLAIELEQKLKPAESAQALIARLGELGFADYNAFLATALAHEMAARDQQLGRRPNSVLTSFEELSAGAKKLEQQVDQIFEAYALNQYVPLNLRVQAAQIGESGATIGVISNNYNIISHEIRNGMNEFIANARQVTRTINDGLFLMATSLVQGEVEAVFQKESASGDNSYINFKEEQRHLAQQRLEYQKKAASGLRSIQRQAELFHQSCISMKRLAAGLEVTRIMGKVESARLTTTRDGLNELINDLETFQTSIAGSLKELANINQNIQFNIEQLLAHCA